MFRLHPPAYHGQTLRSPENADLDQQSDQDDDLHAGDMTYRANPPIGCVLSAREIPSKGGNTHFLDLAACLESRPADLQAAIAGRRLVHDSPLYQRGAERVAGGDFAKVNHPLMITEPLSGRQSLLLGRRRQNAVIGLDKAQGKALLDAVWEPADHDRFAINREWRPGDVVM